MSTTEYKTFVLKVHMNCHGCMSKVRKVLRKIEGVHNVEINAEDQTVTVTGVVDLSTLVQKLAKIGKHAEIWNEDYIKEQMNLVEDSNKNQAQYIIDDHTANEYQYPNPAFGRDQWEINQPWFLNNDANHINHQYLTRIKENPTWEESMIASMRPTTFQQNYGSYYLHY